MLVHLNGQLVEHDQAKVSPFDRGFIFGDGLYEGLRSFVDPRSGQPRVIGLSRHVERLRRGLAALGIAWDATRLPALTDELLAATGLREAFVYWQITRGTPDLSRGPVRSRVPAGAPAPTVFAYASALPAALGTSPSVKRVALVPDVRWGRGDLKTTSLVANVMASMDAAARGADEAVMFRGEGGEALLSEGSHTNVVVALRDGGLATPDLRSTSILPGVTRDLLLGLAPEIEQRPVRLSEVRAAREVMLVGTTTMVTSVSHVDGERVGDGSSAIAARLYDVLVRAIAAGRDE